MPLALPIQAVEAGEQLDNRSALGRIILGYSRVFEVGNQVVLERLEEIVGAVAALQLRQLASERPHGPQGLRRPAWQRRRDARRPILRLVQVSQLIELPARRSQVSHFRDRRGDVHHWRRGETGQIADLHARRADRVIRVQHFPARVVGGKRAHQRTHAIGLRREHTVQRFVDGAPLLARRFALVHYMELGIETGEHGVLLQQAGAEPVHRGNIGALQLAADLCAVAKRVRQSVAHVVGGFVGEGDGQNAQRIDPGRNQALEVRHQNRRLPGSRSSHHASVPWSLLDGDGLQLTGRQSHDDTPSASAGAAMTNRQTSR